MNLLEKAEYAWSEMHQNSYYKTKWKPQNKTRDATITAYYENGGSVPALTSDHFGNSLVAIADIRRATLPEPEPEPEPEPTKPDFLYSVGSLKAAK